MPHPNAESPSRPLPSEVDELLQFLLCYKIKNNNFMAKPIKDKEVHKFYKDSITQLDFIYEIQGLCGGDWWEAIPDPESPHGHVSGETVKITRDITIEIIER